MRARTRTFIALARPRGDARGRARARTTRVMAGAPVPSRELGRVARGARGEAKVIVHAWLDFACPFSGRFWRGFTRALDAHARRNEVCFVVFHQVQPWHAQSGLAHETSIAVARAAGEAAFVKFCDAAFDEANWDAFTDVRVRDMTKGEIYDSYVEIARRGCGLSDAQARAVREALELSASALARGEKNPGNEVTQELKFYIKLGRQTGVHVSPSTYVNGLFVDTSSGWSTEQWHEFLDNALAA